MLHRKLEEYIINYGGNRYTITMYTDGAYKCSGSNCKHNLMDCHHIQDFKNHTAEVISARRFEPKR